MGTKGSLLVRPDGTCRQVSALLSPRFVDAVGAGDSFDAGFVHSFVQGRSLEDSQDFGNLTGALNTTAAGGTGAFASKENARKTAMELFGLDLI
jgi:sugar/nucleoside kinase (ribokinase family)